MAKDQSFADKFARGNKSHLRQCPTCGETIQSVKLVSAEKSDKSGAFRFNQRFVGMCKCNENDIAG